MGLSNYLSSQDKETDIMKYVQQTKESKNLYLFASGPIAPNPSELIGSEKMKELVNHLRKEFDIIIFDTPPLIAVTDASLLSGLVDCFTLVVRAGTTNKRMLTRTLIGLENIGTKIAGLIVNEASEQTLYGGGYTYQYYYQYYSDEDGDKLKW